MECFTTFLYQYLIRIQTQDSFDSFQCSLINARIFNGGWKFCYGDRLGEQQLKTLQFHYGGMAGDPCITRAASTMFEEYRKGIVRTIPANLRPSVFARVLRNGGEKEVGYLYLFFKKLALIRNPTDFSTTPFSMKA